VDGRSILAREQSRPRRSSITNVTSERA
jgi:hypothetical protein